MTILRATLPNQWIIREYKPDYGIDLAVEMFAYCDDAKTKADALGEFLFAQVKSVQIAVVAKLEVFARVNVEKQPLSEERRESLEIDVIPFQIDTNELMTVQAMGSGLPVIMFLVEIDTRRISFVCLSDLIEKVLVPSDPDIYQKATKTVHIPVQNEVTNAVESIEPLLFYAKRTKLYSAF